MAKKCNLQKIYENIKKNSLFGEIKYKKFHLIISKSKLKGNLNTKEIINIFLSSELITKKSKRVLKIENAR